MSTEKRCPRCGLTVDRADAPAHFYRASSRYDGLACYCKTCANLTTARWKHANPARVRQQGALYRARVNAAREAALQDALAAIRQRKGA